MTLVTTKVIDVNFDVTPHLAALKRAGVQTIFGYLNPLGQNEKALTPARARAIANSGLRLGLVSEGWGDFAHNGISANAGRRDALHALRTAPTLGVTDEAVIYFAVDVDATWGQIFSLVVPYFAAIKSAAGGAKIGVYGSGAVCETVLQQQLATHAWLSCSLGWLRSREFAVSDRWQLKQQLPTRVAGVPCDPNVVGANDVGDFVPFSQQLDVPVPDVA